ncbi:hypothetical protein LTR10_008738 [Elasticomyces elasticus]|nr:hypothetical protein LTR10_008738 [Elasticomyces elasticus]KAK4974288.1 hypothetical protein LTR42_004930 [Elasticomyces elasticus]
MSGNNENNGNQQTSGGNFGPGRFGMPGGGGRFGDGRNPELYWELAMMGYGGHRPIFPAGMEPPPGMLAGRRGGRRGRMSRRSVHTVGGFPGAGITGGRGGFGMPGRGGGFPGGMGGGGGLPSRMGGGMPGQGGGMQEMGDFGTPGQGGGLEWAVEEAFLIRWEVQCLGWVAGCREWAALACPVKPEGLLAVWVVDEASLTRREVGCLGRDAEWAAGKTSLPSFR